MAWDTGESIPVRVPAVRIDHLVGEMGWTSLSFIKMDIEGSELRALAGLQHLLRTSEAPPLLFESNGHTLALAGSTPQQLLADVEALDYICYIVEPGRLTRVTSQDLQWQTCADYLAVKRRPLGLGGWTIVPAMTDDDRVRRLLADCHDSNPHCRAYIAGALGTTDGALLRRPEVATALDALSRDANDAVRDAAAWWPVPDPSAAATPQDVVPCL